MSTNGPSTPVSGVRDAGDRRRAFALIALAYAVAGAVAVAVGVLLAGRDPLLVAAAADVAATLAVWGFSVGFRNSSFYDAYWSVAPPLLGLFWLLAPGVAAGVPPSRQALVLLLVTAWAVRLTWNWASGWTGLDHEDWRYVDLRARHGKLFPVVDLFGIHLMPTLLVLAASVPMIPALRTGTAPLGWLDAVAAIVTAGAIAIEAVADLQLRAYLRRGPAPGSIMDEGLWAWSRHPNYFGETSFWWGLYLFGLAADPSWWWTAIGPAAITALFVFVSIPLMDERSLARRPAYAAHAERVPALVPRPPRR